MNEMRVKQIMTKLVVSLSPEETIHQAAAKLAANGISGAPVVENDEVIGMVSEADILHAVAPVFPKRRRSILEILVNTKNFRPMHPPWGPLVRDVMSTMVIFDVSPEASIWEAASLMENRGVKRVPVIDDRGRLVGIVSRADIVRAMGRADSAIASDVLETLEILGPEVFENLEVKVDQGVATIRGEADRKSTKRIALRLVRRVPGVLQVRDELTYNKDDSKTKVELSQSDLDVLNPYMTRTGGPA